MTSFKLVKQSTNRAVTRFSVMNGDALVGTISVKPSQESDLLAHWQETSARPAAKTVAAKATASKAAMIDA